MIDGRTCRLVAQPPHGRRGSASCRLKSKRRPQMTPTVNRSNRYRDVSPLVSWALRVLPMRELASIRSSIRCISPDDVHDLQMMMHAKSALCRELFGMMLLLRRKPCAKPILLAGVRIRLDARGGGPVHCGGGSRSRPRQLCIDMHARVRVVASLKSTCDHSRLQSSEARSPCRYVTMEV